MVGWTASKNSSEAGSSSVHSHGRKGSKGFLASAAAAAVEEGGTAGGEQLPDDSDDAPMTPVVYVVSSELVTAAGTAHTTSRSARYGVPRDPTQQSPLSPCPPVSPAAPAHAAEPQPVAPAVTALRCSGRVSPSAACGGMPSTPLWGRAWPPPSPSHSVASTRQRSSATTHPTVQQVMTGCRAGE